MAGQSSRPQPAGEGHASRSPGSRTLLTTAAAVILLLAGVNVVLRFGPVGIGLVVGPTLTIVLVMLARRAGLSWDELGLARSTWRRGAAYAVGLLGLVAAGYAAALLLPATKTVLATLIERLQEDSPLLAVLLFIPLGTVVLEEVAFRGVLFGLASRRTGAVVASVVSSVLFAAWHLLSTLLPETEPTTVSWRGNPTLAVLLPLAFTCVAGLILCAIRRRSGSLLATVGLHWAINGLGIVLLKVLL